MGFRELLGLLVLVASVAAAAVPLVQAANLAPAFDLVDVDGVALRSEDLLGQIVLLDFGATWCAPCKIVENSYNHTLFPRYGASVVFITVFLPPNDQSTLENYSASHDIRWHLAADSDTLQTRYGVSEMPRMFVIDRAGYVTFDYVPPVPVTEPAITRDVSAALDRAVGGTSTPIDITSLSIPALLVVAALLSFFSPCSFPVLPAFMAFYLNIDQKGEAKASTRVAAGRGFIASLGMVTVYGIIAGVVFVAGVVMQGVIPFISPVVGVVLIAMAVLTLLPYQYHFLTRPFIALKQKIAARMGGTWKPGIRAKLFAFGAGYGAAGFACVAPPFIGAMLNAAAIGAPEQALLGLLLYVIVVIVTMVAVVLGLHIAGDRVLKKIRVWSAVIKYVSAIALMIAGGFLLWLFYVSTVAR